MLATLWLAGVGYVAVGIVQAIAEGSTPPLLKPLLPILKYLVQQPRYVQGVAAVVFLAVLILSAWVTFRAWLVKQEERGKPSPATSRWGGVTGCGVGGV